MSYLQRRLLFLVLIALVPRQVAAQTTVTVAWDQPSASNVTGYRVSLDGSWQDYGVGPAAADGACSCSLALSLAAGAHTFVVAAYNASGETASAPYHYTVGTSASTAPAVPSLPVPASGATGVSTSTTLSWSAAGATSYSIKLDTANPPTTAASPPTALTYQRVFSAGTTYFWQVLAQNSTGVTTGPVWSFKTVESTDIGTMPAPWTNRDIGDVGVAGSATFSNGTFTVAGSGLDIWGAADSFQYLFQPLTGDGEIVVRVATLQNTNANAKAGVMLRGSLDASAPHVMLDAAVDGSIELISRSSAGAQATFLAAAMQSRPIWLKLTRTGSLVTASVSYDGAAWAVFTSTSVDGLAYAGMVVTSADRTVSNVSTFDSATVKAGSQPQQRSADVLRLR
jgi:hypothetical protein